MRFLRRNGVVFKKLGARVRAVLNELRLRARMADDLTGDWKISIEQRMSRQNSGASSEYHRGCAIRASQDF